MADNTELIKQFRAKLVLNGDSIKEFCRANEIDYNQFTQAVNETRPLKEDYRKIINEYGLSPDGLRTLKKIRG